MSEVGLNNVAMISVSKWRKTSTRKFWSILFSLKMEVLVNYLSPDCNGIN